LPIEARVTVAALLALLAQSLDDHLRSVLDPREEHVTALLEGDVLDHRRADDPLDGVPLLVRHARRHVGSSPRTSSAIRAAASRRRMLVVSNTRSVDVKAGMMVAKWSCVERRNTGS